MVLSQLLHLYFICIFIEVQPLRDYEHVTYVSYLCPYLHFSASNSIASSASTSLAILPAMNNGEASFDPVYIETSQKIAG